MDLAKPPQPPSLKGEGLKTRGFLLPRGGKEGEGDKTTHAFGNLSAVSESNRAKTLRREGTEAERILWMRLRNRQLRGRKFRRQHPVGPYIVDFVCLEQSLIVEIDGGQHAVEHSRDAKRAAWLEAEGYRVLRFWNNEVLENLNGVLKAIERALAND